MFQYAAGRALSLHLGQPLKLDVSDFRNYRLRTFELPQCFNCPIQISSDDDLHHILGWQFPYVIRRIISKPQLSILRSSQFVIEPYAHFWNGLRSSPSNCYITGHWLSEKYFKNFESRIRQDYTFKLNLEGENKLFADDISNTNSISLHVRRGDYVSDKKTLATHGICSPDYYHCAINNIADDISNPKFFIFSDDISWVKENIKINYKCKYVDINHGDQAYNDMRLMSLCKHNIIANSTFSWWGGWLNNNPRKIVVAPKKWYSNHSSILDYSRFMGDLIPSGWRLL